MNTAKVAAALNTASLALAELAEALLEQPGSVAVSPPVSSPVPADLPPSFDELPWEEAESADPIPAILAVTDGEEVLARNPQQGSLSSCPKHHVLYRSGRGGTKYCPSPSDDPAWRNDKGFCRITPRNAAAWLAETAA